MGIMGIMGMMERVVGFGVLGEMGYEKKTNLVNECGDYLEARELCGKVADAFGAGDEVEEEDAFFGNASSFENLDGHGGRSAYGDNVSKSTVITFWGILGHDARQEARVARTRQL